MVTKKPPRASLRGAGRVLGGGKGQPPADPRAAPSRPRSHSESITRPRCASPWLYFIYIASLCRHVAKIYWFHAQFHCLFGVREVVNKPIILGGGGLTAPHPAQHPVPSQSLPLMLRTPLSCLAMREQQTGGPNQNDFYAKPEAGGQGAGGETGRSLGSCGGVCSGNPPPPFAGIGVSPLHPQLSHLR